MRVASLLNEPGERGACARALSSSRLRDDARSACVRASMKNANGSARGCAVSAVGSLYAHRENSSVSLRGETPSRDLRTRASSKRRNRNARHFSRV